MALSGVRLLQCLSVASGWPCSQAARSFSRLLSNAPRSFDDQLSSATGDSQGATEGGFDEGWPALDEETGNAFARAVRSHSMQEEAVMDAASAPATSAEGAGQELAEEESGPDAQARAFRALVREAAPLIGCSLSGLASSHSIAYPPLEPEQDLYPEQLWGSECLEVKLIEMYRRHNVTMLCKEQQQVYGTVIAVSRLKAYVDAGASQLMPFFKRELNISQIVEAQVPLSVRRSASDVHVGDKFVFTIESTRSPFGGHWLSPQSASRSTRQDAVWEEIYSAYVNGTAIQGRLLNAVNSGYAIGVGGFVGFMPMSVASPQFVKRIGVLQRFYVATCQQNTRSFVVMDPQAYRRRSDRPPRRR